MENKNVGLLIIGIAIIMVVIVLIFNSALQTIVNQTCSHGESCTMHDTMRSQTFLSLGLTGIITVIGFVIMLTKPKEKIIVKRVKEKRKKIDLSKLDKDEKFIIQLLQKEGGGIFQADLMEQLNTGKVKTTRLLDKLEAKQLIERKRRGMNNIIILKQ